MLARYHYIWDAVLPPVRGGWYFLLLVCLLVVSCGDPSPPPETQTTPTVSTAPPSTGQAVSTPPPITGCNKKSPIIPGMSLDQILDVDPKATYGNKQRGFRIHIPSGYQSNRPVPLVFAFHGYGGTASGLEASIGFSQLADQQGFIVVYPQALPDENGNPLWVGVGPVDDRVDDALFVDNMLTILQRLYCLDEKRIYATGFSNGGSMTAYLACTMTGRIAAFAPVAAPYYNIPGGCEPGRAVSILSFHGTGDTVVPYYEEYTPPAHLRDQFKSLSVPSWLQEWATRDSCTSGPTPFLQKGNVEGEQWSGCKDNANLIHYRLLGTRHVWPGTIDGRSGSQIIWDFFKDHPLPAAAG